jgi:hypothetical protein
MFNKLWSELFKGTEPVATTLQPTDQDICDDWINVEDVDNSQLINIDEHVVLTEADLQRRAKWAKRIQAGRPQRHSQLPTKAQLRQRRRQRAQVVSSTSHHPKRSTSSAQPTTTASSQHTQVLRAKLKLAVSNAESAASIAASDATGSLNTIRSAARKQRDSTQAGRRTRTMSSRCIQQPANRGLN